jgi:hypothetical protein
MSAHQDGYDFVLAEISVMEVVPVLFGLVDFAFGLAGRMCMLDDAEVVDGSTCTISSHCRTIARIKLVFPTPTSCQQLISHKEKRYEIPCLPATQIFNFPILLPLSVNGRLAGIAKLGMTSSTVPLRMTPSSPLSSTST